MKISYNWLQNYFEEKLPEPEIISEGIIFHSFEVEDIESINGDTIFDVKVLPDRAHDCLSHWGIAKEISAIFDLKISSPNGFLKVLGRGGREPVPDHLKNQFGSNLKIEIEDEKCLRYMGRIVRNVKVGESPEWLKEKLASIGQKSINNLVDAANFVMFDIGQPIHCFDLNKLESPKIIIRNGKSSEKITTLDKREVNLDDSILVIADEKDPLAIAGIKGGTKAEVDSNTKNIVIEVANFNPTTTRKTAKKINISTDAVKRYENEISPELCSTVMNSITDLIYSIAGGEVEDIIDVYPVKQKQKIIFISAEYINKRLGSYFSKEEIANVWTKLGFAFEEEDGEFKIEIPFLRLDLTGPHDLTEEVIRILGYDRLEEKLPEIKSDGKINKDYYQMLMSRNKLLSDGYSEVMTYVFRDKGEVEVLASASDKKFLRNNLTDGLKESVVLNQLNLPLLDMNEVKVFEIGTIFLKNKEETHIAYGDRKGVVEMKLNEFLSKNFSTPEIDNLSSEKFLEFLSPTSLTTKEFKMWSSYPFITRDIAVWLPEATSSITLVDIYKELGTDLLVKEPQLVDKFQKQELVSFAYRLVFQSYDKTLTDEEINKIMTSIADKVTSLGFQVR